MSVWGTQGPSRWRKDLWWRGDSVFEGLSFKIFLGSLSFLLSLFLFGSFYLEFTFLVFLALSFFLFFLSFSNFFPFSFSPFSPSVSLYIWVSLSWFYFFGISYSFLLSLLSLFFLFHSFLFLSFLFLFFILFLFFSLLIIFISFRIFGGRGDSVFRRAATLIKSVFWLQNTNTFRRTVCDKGAIQIICDTF